MIYTQRLNISPFDGEGFEGNATPKKRQRCFNDPNPQSPNRNQQYKTSSLYQPRTRSLYRLPSK